MNLIQIQEHLKDLPTQAIMGYANGQNPEVPPYMALGEMNRRKAMEQRAAQAPDSSVKDKLESELSQQVALPGIGQGMNMRINPAGMPQAMPAAQPQMAPKMPGMAIQPAARPTPPQQMSQPGSIPAGAPGMAAGGLAELPVRKDIFNYAPGGIVAFADESNEQLVLPPGTPADASETGVYSEPQAAGIDKLPTGLANKILMDRLSGKVDLPEPVSRDQVRAEVLAQKPELAGIIDKLPGDTLTKLAAKLEEQNQAQRSRFQEGEGRQGLAALSNALIAAGEATRGQKGFGGQLGAAFGGFGKTYNAATQAAEERAAKQQAMERAQTIETMKLQADIEQMQRAFAEGRVDEAMKFKDQINARKAKIEELKGGAAKEVLDTSEKQAQRAAQEARYKAQEEHEKRMEKKADYANSLSAASKPTAEDKKLTTVMARVSADPVIKGLADQAKTMTEDTPEYQSLLRRIEARAAIYYNAAGLTPPPSTEFTGKPAEDKDTRGFWETILPESFGGKPNPADKKVPLSPPLYATNPKTGERKVSLDNGATWKTISGE